MGNLLVRSIWTFALFLGVDENGLLHEGISQRDTNHYDFLNELSTQDLIVQSVSRFWEEKIRPKMYSKDCADCELLYLEVPNSPSLHLTI